LPFHVIVFTEIWFKPDTLSSEVFSSKYRTNRLDRPTRCGGGDLIAVDVELTSEAVILEERNDIKFLGIKLTLPGSSIYIICSYIPTSSEIQTILNKLRDRDQSIV